MMMALPAVRRLDPIEPLIYVKFVTAVKISRGRVSSSEARVLPEQRTRGLWGERMQL